MPAYSSAFSALRTWAAAAATEGELKGMATHTRVLLTAVSRSPQEFNRRTGLPVLMHRFWERSFVFQPLSGLGSSNDSFARNAHKCASLQVVDS